MIPGYYSLLESEVGRQQLREAVRAKALLNLPPEYRELARYDAEVMEDIASMAEAKVEMAEALEERDRLTRAVGGSVKACRGEKCKREGRKIVRSSCTVFAFVIGRRPIQYS